MLGFQDLFFVLDVPILEDSESSLKEKEQICGRGQRGAGQTSAEKERKELRGNEVWGWDQFGGKLGPAYDV